MFVSVKVVCVWTGLTALELLNHVVFLGVFCILAMLKVDRLLNWQDVSWQRIFIPLLIAQALNAYFVTIVFVRSVVGGEMRRKVLGHVGWTLGLVSSLTTSQLWLSRKLDGELDWSYAAIFTPIYLLMPIRMVCSR